MGFDVWSLSSQETSLTIKVTEDKILKIALLLNTERFLEKGLNPVSPR